VHGAERPLRFTSFSARLPCPRLCSKSPGVLCRGGMPHQLNLENDACIQERVASTARLQQKLLTEAAERL